MADARAGARVALAAACLAVTFALYHPVVGFDFAGDDLAFVHPQPDWLRAALVPAGEWHYYPLTKATFSLLGIVSRWHPAPLHVLGLVLHALVGFALARWLARLGLPAWVQWLAALFFLSRGIHYEVVAWITELCYIAVALLTIVTLRSWDLYLRGGGRSWLAWTAIGYGLAVFTIEHALLLAPLFVLYELALHPAPVSGTAEAPPALEMRSLADPRRVLRGALKYVPFVLIALTFLAIKRAHHIGLSWSAASAALHAIPPPVPSGMEVTTRLAADRTWHGMFNAPLTALRDLLSATGFLALPSGWSDRLDLGWLARNLWLGVPVWIAAHIAILWKGPPLARFLLGWIYLYELPLALAGVPQARYHYFAALPAAALVALGVRALLSRWPHGASRRVGLAAMAAIAIATAVGEARFIAARLDPWREASGIMRESMDELRRGLPADAKALVLVNLPRGVPTPFGPAYLFANAAEHLPAMLRPPRRDVVLRTVYDRTFVAERWPTIGAYMSRDSIAALARAPATIVLEFTGAAPWLAPVR